MMLGRGQPKKKWATKQRRELINQAVIVWFE